ncbi:MAG: amidohydrolase [Chitinophagaceae bacterium]|nr:amidohydrolase [Chitinophagaceae bacterium]
MKSGILFFALCLILSSCSKPQADLIVHHAKIYTVNAAFDTASVLVIKDGKVLAVGGDTLLNQYQSKQVVDAQGQFIYPGFIDAHCHFTGYAMDHYKLALFGTRSFQEVLEKVKSYATTSKREWIEGRGWDQNDWAQKVFPTKDSLDILFPNRPVFLLRVDGHAVLCNQKALDLAGITPQTNIPGGEVILKNGQLTGLLLDNVVDQVKKVIPKRTQEEVTEDFIRTQAECFQLGLTGVVDCGVSKYVADWMQAAQEKNKISMRVSFLLSDEKENYDHYLSLKPFRNERLHIAGFKVYADGALGSRGAYLLSDYSDRHGHRGYLITSEDSMKRIATKVAATEYQLCTHAIGDAANRATLNIYGQVLPAKNDRRWRIEHAQVVDTNDIHLFGEHQIIPSVQPTHATSDMYWAGDRLGPQRVKTAYAYKTLLQQNGWLPLGTDFPVESLNPLFTFAAAVNRMDKENFPTNGFQTENALSREEALRGITIWAAKSVFEDDVKGSLEAGKFADFVILPIDLMKASHTELYQTKVTSTYLGGEKK